MLNKLEQIRKSRKSGEAGFTIIEVMIVLAISGLILLIVLLAIPALQRNSRNTAIKNDVSAVSAAISEFKSNNDGVIPGQASVSGGTVTVRGPASNPGTEAVGKVQSGTAVTTDTAPGSNPGTIQVIYGSKCAAADGFTVNTSVRSTAILYNIETSSGVAPRCLDA